MFLSHFNGNETHLVFIKYFITAMRKQIPKEQLRHHAHLIQDLPVVKTTRIFRYKRFNGNQNE